MASAHDTRQAFLSFFARAGHTQVPSAPLVPQGDNTLMFTNAGMVPFKNVFVGLEQRPYTRATSVQKCMRVSGKHNDLEEVGRTARHHTFFEMLGNFSFGDYFKEEAIKLAWQFITEELQIPKERLWITVFAGDKQLPADKEARALWRSISNLPDARILDFGAEDNFWSMGEVGPCGPCTEIHVDLGQGPATAADFANGRIVEIWNNVFMQYERHADGTLVPLPKPAVDTGMGLERAAAFVQGQNSNYHTDLFLPSIDTISAISGHRYGRSDSEDDVSMRVVADHARALAFLVADGVQPGSDGRGYVLRRILRRAIRHGQRLGIERLFLHDVANTVVQTMQGAYPELGDAAALIGKVATLEEESFRRTLGGGLKILSASLDTLTQAHAAADDAAQAKEANDKPTEQPLTLSGELAFKLYDTYGFPKDLTAVIAQERGIALDEAGFDAMMAEQQARSRGAAGPRVHGADALWRRLVQQHGPSMFVGYPHEQAEAIEKRPGQWRLRDGWLEARCTVVDIVVADGSDADSVAAAKAGEQAQLLFSPMPLYGESGGQAGDAGRVVADDEAHSLLAVVDNTVKPIAELSVAKAQLHAPLQRGQSVWVGYDVQARLAVRAHHSATHLLHGALRHVLGEHVSQAGSLVDENHLRFDFAHFAPLTDAERDAIEADVNRRIRAAQPVMTEELTLAVARERGAIALFGEKYDEQVRVLSMGESIELCGGTHAANTSELGIFLLGRDSAVKAGVRRLEAEVGRAALAKGALLAARLAGVAEQLGAGSAARALAPLAQGINCAEDAEYASVQAALTRTLTHLHTLSQASAQSEDGAPLVYTPQALGLTQPQLPQALNQAWVLQARACWQIIVHVSQSRMAQAEQALGALEGDDIGHLAAGVYNLAVMEKAAEKVQAEDDGRALGALGQELAASAKPTPSGVALCCHALAAEQTCDLKALADHVRQALGSGVVCLATQVQGRVTLLVALTPDLSKRLHAGKLVGQLAPLVGGKGGGRPDLAQAGGRDAAGIEAAFAQLQQLIQ